MLQTTKSFFLSLLVFVKKNRCYSIRRNAACKGRFTNKTLSVLYFLKNTQKKNSFYFLMKWRKESKLLLNELLLFHCVWKMLDSFSLGTVSIQIVRNSTLENISFTENWRKFLWNFKCCLRCCRHQCLLVYGEMWMQVFFCWQEIFLHSCILSWPWYENSIWKIEKFVISYDFVYVLCGNLQHLINNHLRRNSQNFILLCALWLAENIKL